MRYVVSRPQDEERFVAVAIEIQKNVSANFIGMLLVCLAQTIPPTAQRGSCESGYGKERFTFFWCCTRLLRHAHEGQSQHDIGA